MFTIRNSQLSSSWHTPPPHTINTHTAREVCCVDVKGSVPLSIAGQGVLSLALCFVWFRFDLPCLDLFTARIDRLERGRIAALAEQIVVQVVPAPSRVVSAPGALREKSGERTR